MDRTRAPSRSASEAVRHSAGLAWSACLYFSGGLAAALLGVGDFFGGVGGRRIDHRGAVVAIAWVASCVGADGGRTVRAGVPPGRLRSHRTSTGRWWLVVFAATVRPLLYFSMERGPMAVVAPDLQPGVAGDPRGRGPADRRPPGRGRVGRSSCWPCRPCCSSPATASLPTNRTSLVGRGSAPGLQSSARCYWVCLSLAFGSDQPRRGGDARVHHPAGRSHRHHPADHPAVPADGTAVTRM